MNREELIRMELDNISGLASRNLKDIENTLSIIRKEKVNLYLNTNDIYRLLILRSWVIRYKVSMEYILRNILVFWEAFVQRRSRKMKSAGLNVRVSTLTGKKSEEILQQMIQKDFPNGLNKVIWKTNNQERIFRIKPNDGIQTVNTVNTKTKTKARTLHKYVKQYKYKIKKENKRREKIQDIFQTKNYRDNPFME